MRPTEGQVRHAQAMGLVTIERKPDGSLVVVDVESRTIEEHAPVDDLDDTHVLLGKLALLVSKWRRLGDMRSDCAQELDELIEEHVETL